MDVKDITGQRFGRWTVVQYFGRPGAHHLWQCQCDCGREKLVRRADLASGLSQSCGCLRSYVSTTHGDASPVTAEWRTWSHMRRRCADPRVRDYPRYGGRGIVVCERWNDYATFLGDMGRKPSSEYSLDRIDNDGNYEPGNCRWATRLQQNNNKANSKRAVV